MAGQGHRFNDLLERDAEQAATRSALDRLFDLDGSTLAIECPAGVGKTSLLAAATAEAETRGALVLSARGVELEHDLAYGVVRQLLLPELLGRTKDDQSALLSGPASLAGVALGLPMPWPGGDPTSAALHGLHWLFVNLAERQPLVLALDDVHWSDEASLRFVAYLSRRVAGLGVLILLAARTAEPGTETVVLDQLLQLPDVQTLHPVPLSAQATTTLVRARLGDVGDLVCRACHTATGGNPYLIGELVEALATESLDHVAASPAMIERIGPKTVARGVLVRLARLPPPAQKLARAVAIFAEGAELRHAAMLAGTEYEEAALLTDRLVDASIFAPGRPLSFLHPIMRSAVYHELPGGGRALLHLRAAQLLRSDGAASARIATHLFESEPGADPHAFGDLVAAGGAALAAGAPAGAVRYLDRALAEPMPAPVAAGARHLRGVARMLTADPMAAEDLRAAADTAADPQLRATALRDLGRVLAFRFETRAAVAALDEALDGRGVGDPGVIARCIVDRTWILWSHDEFGHRFITEMRDLVVNEEPEGFLDRALAAYRAFWEAWHAEDAGRAADLAGRALAKPVLAEEGFDGLPPVALGAVALALADRPAEALLAIEASLRVLRAAGTPMGLTYAHLMAGLVRLYAGDLRRADSDLQLGRQLAEASGGEEGRAANVVLAAVVALERSGPDAAAPLLDQVPAPPTWLGLLLHAARGRVRFAAGQIEAALEDFEAATRSASANGLRHPLYPFPWQAERAMALAAAGQPREARALAEDSLAVARRFGSPAAVGAALRTAGLVSGGDEGIALLREAVDALAASSASLLHAHALVELGSALRRSRQCLAAREPLRLAIDLAGRCGAEGLATLASDEIRAAGARPRRAFLTGAESLTPSERRIAQLAASGRTNRQIAQQLFLTVRTVEMHVSNALTKLGISSRRDISTALGSAPGQDSRAR